MFNRKTAIVCAAAAALGFGASLASASWTYQTGFETSPGSGYDLYYGAVQTTDQYQSATHSIAMPISGGDEALIRVVPTAPITLGEIAGSFSTYVPSSSTDNMPYMYFGVDTNNNGIWEGTDGLVIAFSGGAIPNTVAKDTWFDTGLDGSTKVHVVNDRPGLTAGTYDSSGTQDTLDNLRNTVAFGSTTWGDLSVMRVYVAVGQWPGISTYNAYVDDLAVTAVPEPSYLGLAGMAASALLMRRRRRA